MKKWLSKYLSGLTLIGPLLLVLIIGIEVIRTTGIVATVSETAERAELLILSNALVHEVQKERGMTAGFIGSKGEKFRSELSSQRRLVDSAYNQLKQFLDDHDDSLFEQALAAPLNRQLSRLSSTRASVDSFSIALPDALRFYTTANKYILDFNGVMANRADIPLFKQKFTVLYNIGFAKEASGIERALLSNAFGNKGFTETVYARWLQNTTQQTVYLSAVEALATEEFLPFIRAFKNSQSNTRVQQFRDYASAQGMSPLDREPTEWFAASTARINELKSAEDTLFEEIIAHADSERASAIVLILLEILLLIGVVVLSVFIYMMLNNRKKQSLAIRDVMMSVSDDHDLTVETPIITQDDLGQIAIALNSTLATLRKDFGTLLEYATEIASASEQTASTTEQTSANLKDQRSSIADNRRFAEELDSSIASDIDSIGQVSTNASESRAAAEKGAQTVAEAVTGIKTTAQEVQNVGSIVSELNSRVNDILGMVDVIRSVAEQTNLLALNAAIEAARAGEQGRGFAVVADEVRALAQRTQESTEQISNIVDELTTSSSKALDSVTEGNKKASEAVEQAEQINAVLQNVNTSMVALDDIAKVVAQSAKTQQEAVTKMTGQMRAMDEISQENADGSNYIATAANQLSSIAAEMLMQINRFKV